MVHLPTPVARFYALPAAALCLSLAACGGSGSSSNDSGSGQEPPVTTPSYFTTDWQPGPLPSASLSAPQGLWLATDTHVHTDHSSDGSIWRQASDDALPGNVAVSDQIGEAQRQSLDFLALTDHRTYDQHWDPEWTSEQLLLIPGEEANGRPHANIFGATDTVLDGLSQGSGMEHKPTQQSVWDAHGQGAVWQTNHPNRDWTNDDNSPNDHASTVGVNLIEAWNVAQDIDLQLAYAEQRWNRGWETGITASSDNHFRELWLGFGPGTVKTHVFTSAITERGILNGLRDGHTVLSEGGNAPFLTLTADGQGDGIFEALPGDAVTVAAGDTVTLKLTVTGSNSLQRLRLYAAPGRDSGAIKEFTPSSSGNSFNFDLPRPDTDSPYWVYAELSSPFGRRLALTSPIFIRRSGLDNAPQPEQIVPDTLLLEDNAALVMGDRGRFSGFADIALDGDDIPLVVAEQHSEDGTNILFRRGDSEILHPINTLPGSARFPRIAANGDTVWVTWEDERRGQIPRRPEIMLRGSINGGRNWDAEHRLTADSQRAIRPAIAVLHDGTPVMAWSDNRRRCFDLYVQIGLNSEAENLSSEKSCEGASALDTRSSRDPASLHPAIAVLSDDTVVVAFQDNRFDINPGWTGQTGYHDGLEGLDRTDPDNWEILSRRRDPASGTWSEAVRVSNNGSPDDAFLEGSLADRHPAIIANGEDRLVAVWDAKVLEAAGVNSGIFASHSDDGGLNWTPAVSVGSEDTAMSQRPALTLSTDGSVQALWMDSRDSDWRHRIWGSQWQNGGSWTAARRLSGTGNGVWPRAAGNNLVFGSDRGADAQGDPTWWILHRTPDTVGHTESETPSLNVSDWIRRQWQNLTQTGRESDHSLPMP